MNHHFHEGSAFLVSSLHALSSLLLSLFSASLFLLPYLVIGSQGQFPKPPVSHVTL